jgi:transposase
MARLVRDADGKVFLILDRLRVHRAHLVQDWLADRQTQIAVFYLPAYSPELNPDEGLNSNLKQAVPRMAPARSREELKRNVIGHMRKLAKLPARVRSFFQHPTFRDGLTAAEEIIPARDENDSPVSSQRCGRLIRSARCRLAGERSMGAAVAVTRSELTPAQLRAAACASEEPAQVRRLLAIALVLEGVPRQQAAAQCGMDRQTLPDWVHRYNEGGVAGLRSRSCPGRAPLLTPEQKAELKALVVAGPDPERDKVVRWRCVDLRAEVVRRFGVEVHQSTISEWLHQLGLTRLQPRPYHPKRDLAAQEAYKKTSPRC